MAIGRSSTRPLGIGTALNSLANSATAGAATDTDTPSTSANVTDLIARWAIALGAITTPSASTVINVYVWGISDDTAGARPGYQAGSNEVIPASAGAITLSSVGNAALKFLKSTVCHTASQTVVDEASIVAVLGYIPRRWGLVFINQTSVAFAASGHSVEVDEIYYN